ncbi:MAG: porin, partial [Rubrivivax sp.]
MERVRGRVMNLPLLSSTLSKELFMKNSSRSFHPGLLATAALLALTGAVQAQSSVTLYGAVGVDVVSASKVYSGTSSKSQLLIEDNAIVNSRIGVKGYEDLGGGLGAIFNLESTIKPDTGRANSNDLNGKFWNRGAYVGLTGSLGTLKLGHQWDVADDLMGNYFIFGYYSPFFFSGFDSLSNYYSNAIKYSSPKIGGFEGGLFVALGEQSVSSSAGNFVQGVATYTAGPFSVGLLADSLKSSTGSGDTNDMWALGASYNFGMAKLRGGYAHAEVEIGSPFEANLLDVGVDVPLGPM